jgi:hypothetical protein
MKFKWFSSFIILFLLFLISCSSQSIIIQTPPLTAKPTITNSLIPATITSTVTPLPTFLPAEATGVAVHTREAGAVLTQENFMAVSIPATLEARNVKCKDGFVLEQGLYVIQASNDNWTLFTCSPLPKNKKDQWTPGVTDYGTRYTQITKTDLSQTWIIKHNTFDYSSIDRPDAMLSPYRWTADGKYLYLYPIYYPGGSGFPESAFLYTQINSLYRINLENGAFEPVLQKGQFDAFKLSPDDQFLAYSEHARPDVIHVKAMENGNDLQVKLNEDIVAAGAFIWNAESTMVVFTIGYGKKSDDWQDDLSGISIFILTHKNMHAQKVLAKDFRLFTPYECSQNNYWLDENTLCLYPIDPDSDRWNKIFTFNVKNWNSYISTPLSLNNGR